MKQTISNRSRAFFREHRAILIVMLLLLIERIIAMLALSYEYTLKDDDWAYVISGIVFANTGTIIMHGDLSAQIMPGMPVFLGLISLIFGEGRLYLLVVKILWTLMGTFTAYFIYRSVCLFAPKWCGVVAALPLFAPNLVWLDQLVLTETPYIFCSAAMIYFTLQMGKSEKKRYFWLCALCYLLTLMLKANAGVYPLFAAIYLLLVRYDWKKLLRRYGVDTVSCAARCADALQGGDSYRDLHAVLKSGECFSLRHLAVTGDDLAALGFKGRELGDMLNFLLDYVMEYPANNRREPLLLLASRDEE